MTAPALDDDLDGSRAHVRPAVAAPAPVPVAPPGPGLRQGTIARAALTAVLDAGPPGLLRQLEVTAQLEGSRFVGWQLVQLLDRASPLAAADLAPGDVLLSVNGQPLSRPDELMALWDGLRGANELVAELRRGAARVELRFAIDPPVSAPPPRTSAPPRR